MGQGSAAAMTATSLYLDLSGGGDCTSLYLGGRFHFNRTWAVGAEHADGDDASMILAYVHASF
jgi:hypothetical protein